MTTEQLKDFIGKIVKGIYLSPDKKQIIFRMRTLGHHWAGRIYLMHNNYYADSVIEVIGDIKGLIDKELVNASFESNKKMSYCKLESISECVTFNFAKCNKIILEKIWSGSDCGDGLGTMYGQSFRTRFEARFLGAFGTDLEDILQDVPVPPVFVGEISGADYSHREKSYKRRNRDDGWASNSASNETDFISTFCH